MAVSRGEPGDDGRVEALRAEAPCQRRCLRAHRRQRLLTACRLACELNHGPATRDDILNE